MKNLFRLKGSYALVLFFSIAIFYDRATAQCSGGTSGGALSPAPSASYQTMSIPVAYRYYTFTVAAAACYPTYDFSFCSGTGGSATFDTQITILDNSGNPVSGGYNDDFCSLQSHLTWTPSAAGTYRILISKFGCVATTATSTLAYKYTAVPNMSYSSATTTQASTATLSTCDVNQAILQVQVVTGGGSCNPLSLTQLQMVMSGTSPTTDVSSIHIYYTGTSSTFAATNPFNGAGTAPATGTLSISGTQTLSLGTNYFWIAYDMNSAGTAGNTVDALCPASAAPALVVGGTNRTVTANNPAGSRTITVCPPSPGSVASGLTLWLKPGSGVSTAGTNVTGWTDQSPMGTSVTVNGSPDFTNPGYNFNPYINFTQSSGNGGDYLRIPATNLQSFFWVAQLSNLTRRSTHLATYDGVTTSLPCSGCPIHGGENGGAVAQYHEAGYGGANFQAAGAWRKNGTSTGVSYNTAHSGKFDIVTALGASAAPTNVFLGGQLDLSPGFDGRTRDWLGPVGEVIAYSGSVTAAQANKIESYLAVKYGITLGGNGSTTVYYTSPTGTTIWNSNTGYHYDVMGIGKDVATEGLDQPKSHSINTPVDVVIFANSNFSSPTSMTNNGDYLITGHNNGTLATGITGNFSHNGPFTALQEQLSRVWRTQKTGAPSGNLIMEFDMALINGPTGYGSNANVDIRLLVDNDANFANASAGEHTYSPNAGYAATGGKIYFTVPYSDIQLGTGYFTLASTNSITATLPVELLDLNAVCNAKEITISWKTATEANNQFFTLERGSDQANLLPLATLNGAGTSFESHLYSYTDRLPLDGINYYRLKQTDKNGASQYFPIIESSCDGGDVTAVTGLYPNPVNGILNLEINCQSDDEVTIQLMDEIGRIVIHKTTTIHQGLSTLNINTENLAGGVYPLRVTIARTGYGFITKIVKN